VALSGIGGVDMSSVAFVESNASLEAGHAAHSQCYADSNLAECSSRAIVR